MSNIFLHVGLHKTASTFFQTEIFPYFENTTCITRPYTQQSRGFNKLQFADNTIYNPEDFKLELKQILEKNSNTLISDELLSGIPDLNYLNRSLIADRLSKLFPEGEILIFLRGQKDILLSLYNQYIKMGGTEPINKYIWLPKEEYTYEMYCSQEKKNYWSKKTRYFNHLSSNIHPEHFLYYELIEMYREKFSQVHVLLYEDFIDNPQKFITKIQSIIRQPLKINKDRVYLTNKNKKLSDRKIAITRYQNIIKPIITTNNKYIIRLLALFYGQFIESKKININSSYSEYIDKTLGDFYKKNNLKIIADYPEISLQNHPQKYQI